jgi:hypothetical protein
VLSSQARITVIARPKLPTWQWFWACPDSVKARAVPRRGEPVGRQPRLLAGNAVVAGGGDLVLGQYDVEEELAGLQRGGTITPNRVDRLPRVLATPR